MKVVEGSEVLTTSGWKDVSAISGDMVVLITEGGEISFKTVKSEPAGITQVNELSSKRLSLIVPVGTKTLVRNINTGRTLYETVSSKIHRKMDVLRGSEVKTESKYDPNVVLACAIQADGSYNTTSGSGKYRHKPYWEVQFSRSRKIERFRKALDELEIRYSEYDPDHKGRVKFYIPEYVSEYFMGNLKEKNFDLSKVISESKEKDFLEEVKHWDGSMRNGGWTYCSTNFHNIGVIQALAHMTGQAANYGVQRDTRPIFKSTPKPSYRLNISDRSKIFGYQSRNFQQCGNLPCYDMNTTSGIFIRQNSYVFITKE